MAAIPSEVKTNTLAIVSLIAAIATWLLFGIGLCAIFFIPPIGLCDAALFLVGNAVAAITGYRGRKQIAESDGAEGGDNLAMIGLIAGGIGAVIGLLGVIASAIILIFVGGAMISDF